MRNSARPWQGISLPREVTRIPSMLSQEEKQYLLWLTAESFEGWGAVVDLGPWLGSSSAALAEGLKRRGKGGKVRSLDLFQWEPSYMDSIAGEHHAEGEDFLPFFMREIADYGPWIDARKQDLTAFAWENGPIEILFVDAAKSWELTNAIMRGFGDHLVPGRSRVVLQDFRHHYTHWLPLIFDSRPELWRELESVAAGWTVTFTPLKPLQGPGGIDPDYSESSFPFETAERLLRTRILREPAPALDSGSSQEGWRDGRLLLRTLYRKCLVDGPAEAAQALRRELLAAGIKPEELAELEAISS